MSTQADLATAIRALIDAEGRLPARITPRASRARIDVEDGALRVHVTAPPEDGKANAAAIRAIARALGCPKSAISVLRGHASRDKVFLIRP